MEDSSSRFGRKRRKDSQFTSPKMLGRASSPLPPDAERGMHNLAKKLKKSEAKPHILLVEDSEYDAVMFEQALITARVDVRLTKLRDGQDTLYYLSGLAANVSRDEHPLPDIVLLDLNIPRVPGLEVLRYIREQHDLKDCVIFALTGSDAASDQVKASKLLVDAYLVKPHTFQGLVDLVRDLKRRWLR